MKSVTLDVIVFDAGTQVRAAINEQAVADYANAMSEGAQFPPVVLFHDGSRYYMADGFHRAMAARRVGYREIEARIEAGTQVDALWFALGANKANGHRMTEADKKHAIELALRTWPDRSAHVIADQVGCAQTFVSRIREQVSTSVHLPVRVTGKDGKSYPASRSIAAGVMTVEPPTFKSRVAVAERRDKMRTMAAEGYATRQIASAIGVGEETCRALFKREGIDVPGDRAIGKTHRLDSNRILERTVLDAEHLTADVGLIDFKTIDRERLRGWIDSLNESKRALASFIRRLTEEQKNVEAA